MQSIVAESTNESNNEYALFFGHGRPPCQLSPGPGSEASQVIEKAFCQFPGEPQVDWQERLSPLQDQRLAAISQHGCPNAGAPGEAAVCEAKGQRPPCLQPSPAQQLSLILSWGFKELVPSSHRTSFLESRKNWDNATKKQFLVNPLPCLCVLRNTFPPISGQNRIKIIPAEGGAYQEAGGVGQTAILIILLSHFPIC